MTQGKKGTPSSPTATTLARPGYRLVRGPTKNTEVEIKPTGKQSCPWLANTHQEVHS
jgi:hypothetical protein